MYPYLVLIFFFSSASNGGNSAEKCEISVSIQKGILMKFWKAVNMQKILNYVSLRIRVKEGET